METKNLPLVEESDSESSKEGGLVKSWYKKLRKFLICLMIIITVFTSIGIFIFKDFGVGYKYYEIQNNETLQIGVSQEENIIEKTTEEYLGRLEQDGYYIASSELNIEMFCKQAIINKNKINDEEIKNQIIENLDIQVLCTKLNIKNDKNIYYFKTDSECNKFIEELNKYVKQEYTTEGTTVNYKEISSKELLEEKKNSVIQQKKKIDEQNRKKQYQVTSRGGTTRVNSKYKGGAPMASYTYISSYYGKRGSGNHTGVDFAAPAGTHIYAWKSGKVTFVGWSGGYGKFIIVDHGDGSVSRYAHCSGYAVSQGQTVSKGQTIGYVGTTGNSTGNHLHFEIKINGSFVNPLNYL